MYDFWLRAPNECIRDQRLEINDDNKMYSVDKGISYKLSFLQKD